MEEEYIKKYTIDKYLTKEEIYYRENIKSISKIWEITIKYRLENRIELPLKYKENNFWFVLTEKIKKSIKYLEEFAKENITMKLSGQIQAIITKDNLLNEALNSSIIEGAFSTKKRLKELLNSKEEVKNKDEKMILNNYEVLKFIIKNIDKIFDKNLVLNIQKSITKETLDENDIDEEYRVEPVYVKNSRGEIIHTAPSYELIEDLMNNLYEFINEKKINSIIKSAILHFYFVYVHPFSDGNGRSARALQYFFLLKEGYEIFKMFSISSLLKEERSKYYKSIKNSENDEGDITYFIEFNLEMICRAINNLEKKIENEYSKQIIFKTLEIKKIKLNERQKKIIDIILKKNIDKIDKNFYSKLFKITVETARTDLNKMVNLDILKIEKEGKKEVYFFQKK